MHKTRSPILFLFILSLLSSLCLWPSDAAITTSTAPAAVPQALVFPVLSGTPSPPPAGSIKFYYRGSGLYTLTSAGTESAVAGGGGGGSYQADETTLHLATDTFSIKNGGIANAQIGASAGIARTKMASGTAYRILANNSSGGMSENAALTANRLILSDANGQLVASGVSNTVASYLDPTSSVQTQLDSKLSLAGGTVTGNLKLSGASTTSTVDLTNSTTGSSVPALTIGTLGTYGYISNSQNDDLAVYTNGLEQWLFKAGGPLVTSASNSAPGLGVGLQSPQALIHGHASGAADLRLTTGSSGSTTTDGLRLVQTDSGSALWQHENLFQQFGTNNSQVLMLTAGGNVNVGASGGDNGVVDQAHSELFVETNSASKRGQRLKLASSQSANAWELVSHSETLLSYFDASGYLTLPGSPSSTNQASTKGYVDTQIATRAPSSAVPVSLADVRLTLVSATPVMRSSQTAKTTVYLTPYHGNQITLWKGSAWQATTFTEHPLKLTDTQTGTTTNGSATVTGLTDTSQFLVGDKVSGAGISGGTTISSVDSSTQITLSANATASGSPSLTVKKPADTNFDVYEKLVGSTAVAQPIRWTNNTTRASAIDCSLGVCVKSGDQTLRLIGTVRTSSTDGQTEYTFGGLAAGGTAGNFLLANVDHPLRSPCFVSSSTDNYTYSTATWRAAEGSSTMRCQFLVAVAEREVDAYYQVVAQNSSGHGAVGIGLDTTTGFSGSNDTTSGSAHGSTARLSTTPDVGYHYVSANEYTGQSTTTFYPDQGLPSEFSTGLHFTSWQ